MLKRPGLRFEQLEVRENPAATLPNGFEQTILGDGFGSTIDVEVLPDGRALVSEQEGVIRIIKDGQLLPTPFLQIDVATYTFQTQEEEGLLGVVAGPNFANDPSVYVYYTTTDGVFNFNRISKFKVVGDAVDKNSEQVIFETEKIAAFYAYHLGGAMKFGPDGKLYVAIGEQGYNDRVQRNDSLSGKILRLNPDGSIPTDNPYYNSNEGINRAIWATGFRNPFKMNFNPYSGQLFVNDVGGDEMEEINLVERGGNYGWPLYEGPGNDPRFSDPIYNYSHGPGTFQGFVITGGAFYSPGQSSSFPIQYIGDYFFADGYRNWLHVRDGFTGNVSEFGTDFSFVVDVETGFDGAIYVLERGNGAFASGRLSKITYTGSQTPYLVKDPQSQLLSIGQSHTFTAEVGGTGPLTYQWLRNGNPITGATNSSYTLTNAQLADDQATFSLVVTNTNGSRTSATAMLSVTSDLPPIVNMTLPAITTLYQGGTNLAFAASATDPETGALQASAYQWESYIVTNSILRPLLTPVTGITSGVVQIPSEIAFTRPDVFVRVILTVTDSAGLSTIVVRDIQPQIGTLTVQTNLPQDINLIIEGAPQATPYVRTGIVGITFRVEAPEQVTIDGVVYYFQEWSNGGPREQRVTSGITPGTLTSRYSTDFPGELLSVGQLPPAKVPPVTTVPVVPPSIAPPATPPTTPSSVQTLTSPVVPRLSNVTFTPFAFQFASNVVVTQGDIDGDGIDEVVTIEGAGSQSFVRVYNIQTGELIRERMAYEDTFRGGGFVAVADLDGDGFAEVVTTPGFGGGARVRIFDGRTAEVLGDFFGIEDDAFRGGARLTLADINADGVIDLIVAAGAGGGPRVAMFDGVSFQKLRADFFVFEPTLVNGVYLSAGDIDGDGKDEIAFSGGPGGAPRIQIFRADTLFLNGPNAESYTNFFGGDSTSRAGLAIRFVNDDGDRFADLLTQLGSDVALYRGQDFSPTEPVAESSEEPFTGVFVG